MSALGRRVAVVVALAACAGRDDPAPGVAHAAVTEPARPAMVDAGAARPTGWTFAVMSDLHIPGREGRVWPTVPKTVAALVAAKPRFVIVTGDFTNGAAEDGAGLVRTESAWWVVASAALQPLREADIPVLPVAGNHDTYQLLQRAHYAETFGDLAAWAPPLAIHGGRTGALDGSPFSYSFDVDGVHFALAHVVGQSLPREVDAWLARDLAAASDAKLRLVFGHVPLASVIRPPSTRFVAHFGALLEEGRADAYIAGHEHVVWDEDVALPRGGTLRQVLVGCTSGFYDFSPSPAARVRAKCEPDGGDALRCRMPNGGGRFRLAPGRKGRLIQHYKNSFTLITVDGGRIASVVPMTVDDAGRTLPFYLE